MLREIASRASFDDTSQLIENRCVMAVGNAHFPQCVPRSEVEPNALHALATTDGSGIHPVPRDPRR